MRRVFLILAFVGFAPLKATTYNLPDAAQATFNTQLAAASAGDTIIFPASGTATWSASSTVSKAVTIDGNGTTLTAGGTLGNGFFYVTNFTSSTLMRITGFTFNGVDLTATRHCLKILDSISLTSLRVDNNTFNAGDIQVEVGGSLGVFDHNTFKNANSAVYYTAGSRAQADASWVTIQAGTANALFCETNTFLYDASWLGPDANNSCFDTYNGGKLVVRYNTFTATAVPSSWTSTLGVILSHGNAAGGTASGYWELTPTCNRGQSIIEIYNNTINAKRADYLYQGRGSSNLIHDNTLDTTMFNPRVIVYEEEAWLTGQFSPLRTVWPAEDQVFNTFLWNNTLRLNGTPNASYFEVANDGSQTFIQQNRDYWLASPAASGGSESFSGLGGASSTAPTNGLGNGTMSFSASGANAYYPYTPYQYPHPLVNGNSGSNMGGALTVGGKTNIQ